MEEGKSRGAGTIIMLRCINRSHVAGLQVDLETTYALILTIVLFVCWKAEPCRSITSCC